MFAVFSCNLNLRVLCLNLADARAGRWLRSIRSEEILQITRGKCQDSALSNNARNVPMQHSHVAADDRHPPHRQLWRRGITMNRHVLGNATGMGEIDLAN